MDTSVPRQLFYGTWSMNEGEKTLVRKYEGRKQKSSVTLAGNELKVGMISPKGLRTDTVYRRGPKVRSLRSIGHPRTKFHKPR